MNADSKTSYTEHYKALVADDKSMTGKEPTTNYKYEDLKEVVDVMRKKSDTGISPTKALEVSIDFENITDLDILKEYAKTIGIPGYQAYRSVSALKEKIRTLRSN